MGYDAFISFSSKDGDAADKIRHGLETRGIACWMSSRDVLPGADFGDSIVSALETSRVMVLVFSTNANNSDEVKKELVLAGEYKMPVLPVRIEKVLPSGAFRYQLTIRQYLDLFEDWDTNMAKLAEQITRVVKDRVGPASETGAPADPAQDSLKAAARASMAQRATEEAHRRDMAESAAEQARAQEAARMAQATAAAQAEAAAAAQAQAAATAQAQAAAAAQAQAAAAAQAQAPRPADAVRPAPKPRVAMLAAVGGGLVIVAGALAMMFTRHPEPTPTLVTTTNPADAAPPQTAGLKPFVQPAPAGVSSVSLPPASVPAANPAIASTQPPGDTTAPQHAAPDLEGTATQVLDSGAVIVSGKIVNLFGIRGEDGRPAQAMQRYLKNTGGQLQCFAKGKSYQCFANGEDVAEHAVRNGWARTRDGAPAQYAVAEQEARRVHLGVWAM